jgi:hypothetical protein
METKIDILNELAAISPMISAINKINVFTVPPGYFESVCETVMICLREINIDANTSIEESADIPKGYFDGLATTILEKIKTNESASEEIKYLSPLLFDLQKTNVFPAPTGYFNNLHADVIERIQINLDETASKEISPFLQGLKDKNVFGLPEGYFDGLADSVIKKVQQPLPGKVIPISRRSSWIKYAVAAMMAGIVALGLYKYIDKKGSDAIEVNPAAVAVLDATIKKGTSMSDQQFDEALGNLTETDIAKYLEKHGDITDMVLLKNNLEENSLPNQEDYLLDESTLDNYLKEIETNKLKN